MSFGAKDVWRGFSFYLLSDLLDLRVPDISKGPTDRPRSVSSITVVSLFGGD